MPKRASWWSLLLYPRTVTNTGRGGDHDPEEGIMIPGWRWSSNSSRTHELSPVRGREMIMIPKRESWSSTLPYPRTTYSIWEGWHPPLITKLLLSLVQLKSSHPSLSDLKLNVNVQQFEEPSAYQKYMSQGMRRRSMYRNWNWWKTQDQKWGISTPCIKGIKTFVRDVHSYNLQPLLSTRGVPNTLLSSSSGTWRI